jgi:hypothetical protein
MAGLGKTSLVGGIFCFALAVVWWWALFEQLLGADVKTASECFYYTTELCAVGGLIGVVGAFPCIHRRSFGLR